MIVWAMAATFVAITVIFLFGMYRRQVKNTCRQLQFLQEHQTRLRITGELFFGELWELAERINDVLESSLEAKNKTLHREEELRQTIANLSHDIRTPLTSLEGYFYLLKENHSTEEYERYMQIMEERIGRLSEMLEELFMYTKIQDEGYELERERVSLTKLTQQSVLSFYEELKKRGTEPVVVMPEQNIAIVGNEAAVSRVLQNVIKNALEHSDGDLSIRVCEKERQVSFCCSNRVANPQDIEIEQVFERFYRADMARTRTSTGLGLSIARGLMEKMDGELTAALEENFFIIKAVWKKIG